MSRMFFNVEVGRREALSPGMVRITFRGEELADFHSTGIGDEYLRLFFPHEESGEVILPIIDDEGRWTYREDKPPVRCATYTVRRFDAGAGELDIDFVVHEGGVASTWAQSVAPGSPMIVNRPRGLYELPEGAEWQLLMADATGIPALARLLEQTPETVRSRVIIEVAENGHRQPLPEHPGAVVTWIEGTGNGAAASLLDAAFGAVHLPEAPGYIWVAAEQKPVRAIRKHVRQVLKWPAEHSKLVAYWIEEKKQDKAAPRKVLPEAMRAEIGAAWFFSRDAGETPENVEPATGDSDR